MITALAVLCLGFPSFAAEKATGEELSLLCTSVDMALEEIQADVGLDTESCMNNQEATSRLFTEGVRVVEATLTFNAPSRPSFELDCSVAYEVSPEVENLIAMAVCE